MSSTEHAGVDRNHAPVATSGLLRGFLALLAMTSMAACGFQLRGATDMPFKTLYTNFAETSQLGSEFKRTFRQQGDARIVPALAEADAWLDIQAETRDKEIVAFSSTG